jgi:hypothetical protein
MAHIAHQPGPMRVEGIVSLLAAGWPGGWFWGVELHHRHSRRGALLQFECLRKNARGRWPLGPGAPKAWAGMAQLRPLLRGETGGEKPLLCQRFKSLVECARDQVVIARPPVLTPPRHYRRSLVSKGRFTTPTNMICVGIRSGLPKRRYRVVIDYVAGPLRHRGKAGCRLFRGSRHMCEFGKTASCLWVFVVVASD